MVHHQHIGPAPQILVAGECVRGSWDSGAAGNFPSPAPEGLDLVTVLLEQSVLGWLCVRVNRLLCPRLREGNRAGSRNQAAPSQKLCGATPLSAPRTAHDDQSGTKRPFRAALRRRLPTETGSPVIPCATLFRSQRPPSNFLAFLMKVKTRRITFRTAMYGGL